MPHAGIPAREAFFHEAKLSVAYQTRSADQFIIELDRDRTGCAATQNRALERVTSEWVALLGDDDYFLPDHLAVLEAHTAGADVVYPDCIELGGEHGVGGEFDEARLRQANYIPGGGSLIRTSAARKVGGWVRSDDPDWHRFEDWAMWLRLLDAGYTFCHVPQQTWVYRFHAAQTGGQA